MKDLFRVVFLLLRVSKDVPRSRVLVASIIVAGLISGLCNTLLIATINSSLHQTQAPTSTIVLTFAALCFVLASLRFVSGALLVHLMKKVTVSLRLQLCRKVLNAPLRLLEQLGSARLIATLTSDVRSITSAYIFLPGLCMNFAILLGCMIYLCWL